MVALVDERQRGHTPCWQYLGRIPQTALLTTWACLTETLHILPGGRRADLLRLWENDLIRVAPPDALDDAYCRAFLQTYVFADLADASLVAVAERTGLRTVFTLDSDFDYYRLTDGRTALQPVPPRITDTR